MRFIYIILFAFISCLLPKQVFTQNVELQGIGGIDCTDNLFHLNIQVRNADPSTIKIGSFSIFFLYDESVITFNSFNSQNFDGSSLCNGGTTAWAIPKYRNLDGKFNMNFIIKEGIEASSCPEIDNNWMDVAEIIFNVNDFPKASDIAFVLDHSHFNLNLPNNGMNSMNITANSISVNNCLGDFDMDGISDELDNCPFVANPGQEDLNNNLVGDICEAGCDLVTYTGGDVVLCSGNMVTLASSAIGGKPPYNYVWSNGETNGIITVSETSTTPYYISITDNEGCIDVDTVNVVISDMNVQDGLIVLQTSPTWTNIDTIYDGDVVNFEDLPEFYRLRSIHEGAVESMSLALTGNINYTRTDNTSRFDFFESNTGGNLFLTPGTYNMNLKPYAKKDLLGVSCMERDINFTVVSQCEIDLGKDTSFCLGESLILDATSQGVAPFSYNWSTGNTIDSSINVSPAKDSSFMVTVTDANGCRIVDYINIDIYDSGTLEYITIIDQFTGLPYDTIEGGETYLIDDLPLNYNIEFNTINVEGSLGMDLTGPTNLSRTSNVNPHLLIETNDPFDFLVGDYNLEATAYTSNNKTGESCSSKNVSFKVTSCPRIEMEDEIIFCSAISSNSTQVVKPIINGDSGPYTFAWSDGSSADSLIVPQPLVATTYYLSLTNANPSCEMVVDSFEVFASNIDIVNLVIWDLDNNSIHDIMEDGDIYRQSDLPSNYGIEAMTSGAVGSIGFYLSGDLEDGDLENGAPYRYNGDNYIANFPPGNYTMTTNIYSEAYYGGPSCEESIISFTIVDCVDIPVAGIQYDFCETHSNAIINNNSWQDIKDEHGQIIASLQVPNSVDIGTVTVDVTRSQNVGTLNFNDGGDVKLLPRHFHIKSSNYTKNNNFPDPIKVKLYFTDDELTSLNASDNGDYGISNYRANELLLSHYYGDNQDCSFENNAMIPNSYNRPSLAHQQLSCNDHYLEFEVRHFSEFIFHEPYTMLPVELISFKGELIDLKTKLEWKTATEENVNGFIIEKSADAREWEVIELVTANNTGSDYIAWDNVPFEGFNYYRLKIMDLDGSYEYSKIINVVLDHENSVGEIIPNPVRNDFSLSIDALQNTKAQVQISNNLGQVLFAGSQSINKGESNLSFSTNEFPNGIYWIRIIIEGNNFIRKFEVLK